MDSHSINRIRNANFAHAVRGYDRHEVDQFLSELADWLERDAGGGVASVEVRDELERVGEQVAGILTEAHDAAEEIRENASSEVRKSLVQANVTAESLRTQADEYADEKREEADLHARSARTDADSYAEQTREAADAAAAESREAAEREAQRIVEDANRRKRDTEAVISDLEARRDGVLAELERLASGITGTATQHRGEGSEAPQNDDNSRDSASSGSRQSNSG